MWVRCSIFPNNLRYQILADDGAECDVGNRDADDKADDLNELSRLRNGSPTGADECGCETADDQRNKPRAANSYDKKSSHALKYWNYVGSLFIVVISTSNERKLSDSQRLFAGVRG